MNEEKERPAGNPLSKHRRFGKFILLSSLESGAFAHLYKAHDSEKNRDVLLRILSPSVSENPTFQEYIDDLVKNRGRFINDPAVLRLLEAGRTGKRIYFAYEHVKAESLESVLHKRRLGNDEALSILRQATEGLRAFHAKRIIHGDVKPSNILVYKDSSNQLHVKLSPTDLATATSEAMVSVYGSLVGTPEYLSPELIQGKSAELRSDIYSLGVVAYEMFAGRPPFEAENPLGYIRAHCEEDPLPLVLQDNTIPDEVSMVVARMMSRDPRKRYRSCQNLLDDLDRVEARMAGEKTELVPAGIDSAFAVEPTQPATSSKGPWKTVAMVAIALCVIMLAGMAAIFIWLSPAFMDTTITDDGDATDAVRGPDEEPRAPVARDAIERQFRLVESDADRILGSTGDFEAAYIKLGEFAAEHEGGFWGREAEEKQAQILGKRADAYRRSGRYEEAVSVYRELRRRHSERRAALEAEGALANTLFEWSEKSFENNRWREGVERLENIIGEFPRTSASRRAEDILPQKHLDWAEFLRDETDTEEELAVLERMLDRYGESPLRDRAESRRRDALLRMGRRLQGRGDYARAAKTFSELIDVARGTGMSALAQEAHAQSLALWANKLFQEALPLEAVEVWAELMERYPDSEHIERYPDLKKVAELADTLRRDAEREEAILEDSVLLSRWAARLAEDNERDKAAKTYQQILDKHPGSYAISRAKSALARFAYESAQNLVAKGELGNALEAMAELADKYSDTDYGRAAGRFVERMENAPEGMVYVPAGEFKMGLSEEQTARLAERHGISEGLIGLEFGSQTPQHTVNLDGFFMDITPVTNSAYLKFVEETEHRAPESPDWDGSRVRENRESYPVTGVTYRDAQAYADWAGKRLPTEQEWEKAARGPDGRLYPWGNSFDASRANVRGGEGGGVTRVGRFRDGASVYGCLDMIGNVWEWTNSPYLPYPDSDISAGFDRNMRVARGGSWQEREPYHLTVTVRLPNAPDSRSPRLGFRCFMDAD